MAAKSTKKLVEILLVEAELKGVPEKTLLKSRNLGTVDLIWPRAGIAKKTAARQFVFTRGKVDFTAEPWAKRILFREEIDGHAAFAVSISEPVTVQKIRHFLDLTARYILREGADVAGSALAGYGDIASAPIDALAAIVGEKDAPKTIAQGVLDLTEEMLPAEGETVRVTVPLARPVLNRALGTVTLEIRG